FLLARSSFRGARGEQESLFSCSSPSPPRALSPPAPSSQIPAIAQLGTRELSSTHLPSEFSRTRASPRRLAILSAHYRSTSSAFPCSNSADRGSAPRRR